MKPLLRSPFVSAAVGGIAVAGAFLALGVTGRRTIMTVIQEAPLSGEPASDAATGLTPYEIYQSAAPSVVFVRADVEQTVDDPFGPSPTPSSGSISTGSGFVIDRQGDILTDYHVVAGAGSGGISVGFEHGVMRTARIVGEDPSHDLAMLRVPARGLHVAPLPFGNSATARVGDPTLALGNPFGVDRTLTTGIVSALQRQIVSISGFAIDNVIQTDTPLDPGASGGPLIDAAGRVIGISSEIQTSQGGTSVGVGFAVPINTASSLFPRLDGAVAASPGYLGVGGATIDGSLAAVGVQARHGVLVESVDPDGPAAKVGLRAATVKRVVNGHRVYLGGDVIVRIDGTAANSVNDLSRVVASKRAGEVVDLTVLNGRKLETVDVTLARGLGSR